jgi:hypothetical protein
MALSRMSFNELGLIESKNVSGDSSSSPGTCFGIRFLAGCSRFQPLQRPEFGRILEPTLAAWPGRLDYTQLLLASRANQRATGGPPSVVFELICFPDADPTMPPR